MRWAVLDVLADDSARCAGEVASFLHDRLCHHLLVLRLGGPLDLARILPDPDEGDPSCVLEGVVVAPHGRPTRSAWVRAVRDACLRSRVHFSFAGWGRYLPHDQAPDHVDVDDVVLPPGFTAESALWRVPAGELRPLLDGREHRDLPPHLPPEWARLWGARG